MNSTKLGGRRMERRRAPRYRYQAVLEIEWGSARLNGRTRDVSEGGMFIESEDILWVGAGFRVRLTMDQPLWLDCDVRRVEPGCGMGVVVQVPEGQSLRHYHELIQKLAAGA